MSNVETQNYSVTVVPNKTNKGQVLSYDLLIYDSGNSYIPLHFKNGVLWELGEETVEKDSTRRCYNLNAEQVHYLAQAVWHPANIESLELFKTVLATTLPHYGIKMSEVILSEQELPTEEPLTADTQEEPLADEDVTLVDSEQVQSKDYVKEISESENRLKEIGKQFDLK